MSLHDYVRAGYPALAVQTVEEERLISDLLTSYPNKQVWSVNGVGILRDLRKGTDIDAKAGYFGAFAKLSAANHQTILVVLDLQHNIRQAGGYRPLRDVLRVVKRTGHLIVLIAPSFSLSEELAHEVPVITWELPTREQLGNALTVCQRAVGLTENPENRETLLDSGAGLTLSEAEGAFALSWDRADKSFDRTKVESVKMGIIRQSGALSLEAPRPIGDIGGLGQLKSYIREEVLASVSDIEVSIKGFILVGVPGSGKSLTARATGSLLQWPLIRLNLAAVKGSLVGQSEAQLRQALNCIDAVSPCVVWLDEIEKAIGGYASSANTDSGVTLSLVGELLTWLDKPRQSIVVATCNDHLKLPSEFTRAGRFDSQWFVDLPTLGERREIIRVHLNRYKLSGEIVEHIALNSDNWTGAELEGCIRSIARRSRAGTPLDSAMIQSIAQVVPLSRSRETEINRLREWGKSCCLQANDTELTETENARRME